MAKYQPHVDSDVADERRESLSKRFYKRYRDEMPQQAYNMLAAGKTQAQIAAKFGVTDKTLQNWKNPNHKVYKEEFAYYYEAGVQQNKAWWDDVAQHQMNNPDSNFDATLYVIERKRRHGAADSRTVDLENLANAQTYSEQAKAVKNALATGELTTEESTKMATALEKLARVQDMDTLLNEMRELKQFKDEYLKSRGSKNGK